MFAMSITDSDIEKLELYNSDILRGVEPTEALKNNLLGASDGAVKLAKEAIATADGTRKATVNTEGLSGATAGYTATAIGARIATVALQTAISFGIALAVQGLIELFNQLKNAIPTVENTTQWLKDSSEEVKSLQSDISDLNGKLDTTKERIEELLNKEHPTIVEQNELDRLQRTNSELERQIQLKQRSLEVSQSKNAKNFVGNVNELKDNGISYGFGYKYDDDVTSGNENAKGEWRSDILDTSNQKQSEYFKYRIEDYKIYVEQIEDYQKRAIAAYKSGNEAEGKEWENKISEVKNKKEKVGAALSSYATDLQEAYDKLGDYDYNSLSNEAKEAVNYYNDVQNTYNKLLGNDSTILSNIYNQERFAEGKKAIESLKESGKLTADTLKSLYDSNENVRAMIDNMEQVGLISNKSIETFGLLSDKVNGVGNAFNDNGDKVDNAVKHIMTFQELMEEKGTDKNPSFVESIEKSIEKVQKLEESLSKFESGTLTSKDKTSLYKTFPQLTAYADNLGEGIRKLLGTMKTDVVSQFTEKIAEFKKQGASQEDIERLIAYKNTVLNIIQSVDSVKNALDSMRNVFKDLDSIVGDYNKNGYFTIDNLEKLSSSGQRYLQYLSYENGQLKVNQEAYKKLVLAQIDEIETKATLQATTDLESLTSETAAKEYLAKVNIELASSQLTAAQAAFQYALALKLAEGGDVAKAAQKIADNLNTLRNVFASARGSVDSYSAGMLGATKEAEAATKALEAQQKALENNKTALENEKKALEKTKTGYENAKSAIQSLIEWTQKYIKQVKEDEIKSLEEKKDKFDEVVEAEKEALQAEKELHDYEKSLKEKQDSLASSALKTAVASLDDSAAGKKAYKKAQEEYKTAQKDVQEFVYEHGIEVREKSLDELKEATDKSYQEQIDSIQEFLNNEVELYHAACSMIDNDNGDLYDKLLGYCLKYTTTGKSEFDHMWSAAKSALEEYNGENLATIDLMDSLQGSIYAVDDAINAVSESISNYETMISNVKSQVDDLKNAAVEAKNALDAANGTPLPPAASISPAASPVTRASQTSTSKQKTTPTSNIKTWSVNYLGTDFTTRSYDRNAAIDNLYKQIKKKYPLLPSLYDPINKGVINFQWRSIFSGLHSYAKGTKSAKGGLSIVDEEGLFSEFIPYQIDKGRYSFLPEGNPVFSKAMTNTMFDFASNPTSYVNKIVNSSNRQSGDINIDSPIYIQGDATQSTVRAIKKEKEEITDNILKKVLHYGLMNKKPLW